MSPCINMEHNIGTLSCPHASILYFPSFIYSEKCYFIIGNQYYIYIIIEHDTRLRSRFLGRFLFLMLGLICIFSFPSRWKFLVSALSLSTQKPPPALILVTDYVYRIPQCYLCSLCWCLYYIILYYTNSHLVVTSANYRINSYLHYSPYISVSSSLSIINNELLTFNMLMQRFYILPYL